MAEFKMVAIIKLSENEWVWVRVRISWSQSFVQNGWIEDGRIQDGCHHQVESEWLSEMSNVWILKMSEFKMAAIIKLSQNEWVKIFLCKMAESMMADFKMAAIIKLSQNEWVKVFFVQMNPRWELMAWQVWVSLREKTKMAESNMAKFKMAEFKMAAIIKWVNQIELVWVRVRVEWECFWVNLREDNKVSESNMAEFKMAAIINEFESVN